MAQFVALNNFFIAIYGLNWIFCRPTGSVCGKKLNKEKNNTYVLTCGTISWVVCLQASTQDRRNFLTFSRSSGQSRDCPMWISKSRNSATWLLISTISCKWKQNTGRKKRKILALRELITFHVASLFGVTVSLISIRAWAAVCVLTEIRGGRVNPNLVTQLKIKRSSNFRALCVALPHKTWQNLSSSYRFFFSLLFALTLGKIAINLVWKQTHKVFMPRGSMR